MIKLVFAFSMFLTMFHLSMSLSIFSKRLYDTLDQDQSNIEPLEEVISFFRDLFTTLSGDARDHEIMLARALMKKIIDHKMQREREEVPDYWLLRQG